jgi:hypothetical protein
MGGHSVLHQEFQEHLSVRVLGVHCLLLQHGIHLADTNVQQIVEEDVHLIRIGWTLCLVTFLMLVWMVRESDMRP